jgi:hypothetical protein
MRGAAVFPVFLALAILSLLLVPTEAPAQHTLTPEHQRLSSIVGEWSFVVGEWSCTSVNKQFGDFFVRVDGSCTDTSGHTSRRLQVYGYDPEEGVYWWHRYSDNGLSGSMKGWVKGNTWTFVSEEPGGTKLRCTATEESPDVTTVKWERSVDDGPWEVTSELTATRVK